MPIGSLANQGPNFFRPGGLTENCYIINSETITIVTGIITKLILSECSWPVRHYQK